MTGKIPVSNVHWRSDRIDMADLFVVPLYKNPARLSAGFRRANMYELFLNAFAYNVLHEDRGEILSFRP
jgi:hypothetical protein